MPSDREILRELLARRREAQNQAEQELTDACAEMVRLVSLDLHRGGLDSLDPDRIVSLAGAIAARKRLHDAARAECRELLDRLGSAP